MKRVKFSLDIIRDDVLIVTLGYSSQDRSIYLGVLNLLASVIFPRKYSKKSRGPKKK